MGVLRMLRTWLHGEPDGESIPVVFPGRTPVDLTPAEERRHAQAQIEEARRHLRALDIRAEVHQQRGTEQRGDD
jgi:hypothetical protein